MKQQQIKKILLAGEGGQGIQTIAYALAEAAAKSGYESSYIPVFGVEQRGTPSIAFIILSNQPIRYPRFEVADIAVILRSRAVPKVAQYLSPNTITIFDSSTVDSRLFDKRVSSLFAIPATKIATELYHPKSFNMILLGVMSKALKIDPDISWGMALKNLGSKFKNKVIEEQNHGAFLYGYEAVLEQGSYSKAVYETKKSDNIYRNNEKVAVISPSLCKGCGICILKCPVKVLSFGEDLGVFANPVPTIDLNKCIVCGICRSFCPDSAIGVNKV